MEREKHSYPNHVVPANKNNFTSIIIADKEPICGFVTWLFLPIFPNILFSKYSGICGTQENGNWQKEEPKKMRVQTRILEQAQDRNDQGVNKFTQVLVTLPTTSARARNFRSEKQNLYAGYDW